MEGNLLGMFSKDLLSLFKFGCAMISLVQI